MTDRKTNNIYAHFFHYAMMILKKKLELSATTNKLKRGAKATSIVNDTFNKFQAFFKT